MDFVNPFEQKAVFCHTSHVTLWGCRSTPKGYNLFKGFFKTFFIRGAKFCNSKYRYCIANAIQYHLLGDTPKTPLMLRRLLRRERPLGQL